MNISNPDTNWITEKVEKYSDLLLRIAFSYMKNIHDAEDMVQETFVKLIQKKPLPAPSEQAFQFTLFESEEHEKAWLIRVTINQCKNRLKTAWFKKTESLEEQEISFTEQEGDIINTINELPTKYRSVILLYYNEGYRIKEIADILGYKEATVASQLQRARKQLKIKLKEDFDYE